MQVFKCRVSDFWRQILQLFETNNITKEVYLLIELNGRLGGFLASLPNRPLFFAPITERQFWRFVFSLF